MSQNTSTRQNTGAHSETNNFKSSIFRSLTGFWIHFYLKVLRLKHLCWQEEQHQSPLLLSVLQGTYIFPSFSSTTMNTIKFSYMENFLLEKSKLIHVQLEENWRCLSTFARKHFILLCIFIKTLWNKFAIIYPEMSNNDITEFKLNRRLRIMSH